MSVPFVASLRTTGEPVRIGGGDGAALQLRVEMPEVWDTIRVEAAASEPVRVIKLHALERLYPGARAHDDYVMKLGGIEVLDETVSLADAGARDGSIFLLTSRRRRPVR